MFLAFFIPALMGALATVMASLIGRAVLALGIGFVTYKGLNLALEGMQQAAISSVSGIGGDAVSLLGYLWVDKAISVMFSAVTVSLSMRLIAGSVKKMIFK